MWAPPSASTIVTCSGSTKADAPEHRCLLANLGEKPAKGRPDIGSFRVVLHIHKAEPAFRNAGTRTAYRPPPPRHPRGPRGAAGCRVPPAAPGRRRRRDCPRMSGRYRARHDGRRRATARQESQAPPTRRNPTSSRRRAKASMAFVSAGESRPRPGTRSPNPPRSSENVSRDSRTRSGRVSGLVVEAGLIAPTCVATAAEPAVAGASVAKGRFMAAPPRHARAPAGSRGPGSGRRCRGRFRVRPRREGRSRRPRHGGPICRIFSIRALRSTLPPSKGSRLGLWATTRTRSARQRVIVPAQLPRVNARSGIPPSGDA